jgi:hypothetical protein
MPIGNFAARTGTLPHPMPTMARLFAPLLALLLVACSATAPTRPPASGSAPTADTARVLLAALDSEALYTIAGGLKPVSEGFWHGNVRSDQPDLAAVSAARAALAPWRNDTLWADVHVFHEAHDGKRAARGYVVDRRALAELLHAHAAFFAPFGLGPDTHPAEVMAVVERLPKLDRHRALGLLFGYPQHAIEFFLAAEIARDAGTEPAPRRFVQIPAFVSPTGRFVYAVGKDDPERPEDRDLATAAAPRLQRYRELRAATTVDDAAALLALTRQLQQEFAPAAARR